MKKYGLCGDVSFEQTLSRLRTRGLVASKSDYLAVDALYNLVKDLHVVPIGTVNVFKKAIMLGVMLINGVPFGKCREAMDGFNLNCLEKQIVGFSKRLKVSGGQSLSASAIRNCGI